MDGGEGADLEMNKRSFIAELADRRLKGPDGPVPRAFLADSRLVRPGDGFVAFRGENTDGHEFISSAVSNGASLIICEDDSRIPEGVASICVENTYEALPLMAKKRLSMQPQTEVIAITGSVGKTTTREFLVRCLSPSFRVHSAGHSYNTLIGCAMTVLSLPVDAEVLVLEMGTNHPGEIREMVSFFPPTLSVVTEVAPAHLEGFGSIEGVLDAKMEITDSERIKAFFFNGDNPLLRKSAASRSGMLSYSVGFGKSDFQVQGLEFHVEENCPRLSFDFKYPGGGSFVQAQTFGAHSAYALGFALGVCFYLGASREKAIAAIENAQSLEGRGRILTLPPGITLIDDSYNANPSSLSASLSAASSISAGRRFAVIGEMLELGKSGVDFHEKILPMLSPFDKVWLVGNMWKEVSKNVSLSENLVLWNDVPKLGVFLSGELRKGDVLLVKGSHGNRLDRIVSFLAGRNLR